MEIDPVGSNRYRISIAPHATIPIGQFEGRVLFTTLDKNGTRAFGATLPVFGNMQREVRILPALVMLGPQDVGATVKSILLLQIPSDLDFKLHQIESSSTEMEVRKTDLPGVRDGLAYELSQRIARSGDDRTQLAFDVSIGPQIRRRVPVVVTYHGVVNTPNQDEQRP